MKIENEKIIQATEVELYSYWLSRGWDDVYAFPEYMQRMKDAGCEVIAEIPPTLFARITVSPEVLAGNFIHKILTEHDEYKWRGEIGYINWKSAEFDSRDEAIAATVAKLKEVCDE